MQVRLDCLSSCSTIPSFVVLLFQRWIKVKTLLICTTSKGSAVGHPLPAEYAGGKSVFDKSMIK